MHGSNAELDGVEQHLFGCGRCDQRWLFRSSDQYRSQSDRQCQLCLQQWGVECTFQRQLHRYGCTNPGSSSDPGACSNTSASAQHARRQVLIQHKKDMAMNITQFLRAAIATTVVGSSLMIGSVATAQSVIPTANLDGVGSLIDPTNSGQCSSFGGWGCYRDEVRLWGGTGSPSSGVFQVLNTAGMCDYVTITSPASTNYITVKYWNEAYPGEKYSDSLSTVYWGSSTTMRVPVPVGWSTINVTTGNALPSGSSSLVMTCGYGSSATSAVGVVAPSVSQRRANPNTVANYLQTFDTSVRWTGNGSLITFSGNSTNSDSVAGYGRNLDISVTQSGYFAGVFFQVYSGSSVCRNVRISGASSAAQILYKGWSERNWVPVPNSQSIGASLTSVTVPYTVSLPANGYYLIRVEPFVTTAAQVEARCV